MQENSENDLGELARGEWKLANNSFLLHGYYNYHHLLLIEEGDDCILGVPGIYHRRERQAQSALVFWNFGKQKDCRSHFLSKSEMIMRDLDIGAEK